MNFQKIGGLASIGIAFLSVLMLILMFLIFPNIGLKQEVLNDPIKVMSIWATSPATFLLWDIQFVFWGIFFLPLVLVLKNKLNTGAPNLMLIATICASVACSLWMLYGSIGIIGREIVYMAKDISGWRAFESINLSISRAGDFAQGWALLMIGIAALKTEKLSRLLSWLLIIQGLIYILGLAVDILGLIGMPLIILTSIWLGKVLLTDNPK